MRGPAIRGIIIDLEILSALSSRQRYERYSRFVKLSSLTEESANILQAMGEWYSSNPSTETISWKGFSAWFVLVRNSKMDKAKLELHKQLLAILERGDVPEADIKPLLEGLAKRDYASQIADTALRVADGDSKATLDGVRKLLDDYDSHSGRVDEVEGYVGDFTLDRLQSVAGPGLQWRLQCLNDGAGELREGDLVMFGKRPDSGGTTWVAQEATYMAEQMSFDENVLWFNNEEQGDKVRRRIVQAALGWTAEEIEEFLPEALEQYTDLMGGNRNKIRVYDKSRIHIKEADHAIKKFKPRLIICDQLWKFKGFEHEGDVNNQTHLANWAREKAKEGTSVIAVHQLGGDAENQLYPTMDMLFGSKTGIQGEADLIITMGRKWSMEGKRGIFLPKNKLLTPGDKSKRNGKWIVNIDTDRARIE